MSLNYEANIFYRIRLYKEDNDGKKVEILDNSELIEANYVYAQNESLINREKVFDWIVQTTVTTKIKSDYLINALPG